MSVEQLRSSADAPALKRGKNKLDREKEAADAIVTRCGSYINAIRVKSVRHHLFSFARLAFSQVLMRVLLIVNTSASFVTARARAVIHKARPLTTKSY